MTVQVAVRALLRGKHAKSGIVGQVFRQDQNQGVIYVRSMTLPMMNYGDENGRVAEELSELKPGSYFMQIALPNGKLFTEPFEVNAGQETKLLIDLPHQGPNDWTALQSMTGHLRQKGRKELQKIATRTRGVGNLLKSSIHTLSPHKTTEPAENHHLVFLATGQGKGQNLLAGKDVIGKLSGLITERLTADDALKRLGYGMELHTPSREDSNYAVYRFGHQGLLADDQEDLEQYDFRSGPPLERNYLALHGRQGDMLICLPTPWTIPDGSAEVELFVNKNSEEGIPHFSITIDEPMVNTVLGYLNAGMIHKAMELVNYSHAEMMLYEKVLCPLSAAVGGYLLVFGLDRKGYRTSSKKWKTWVENLDQWFEWLPDGAILHAALHFMLGDPDSEQAYEALMRAYQRGLPFFTFGLKLLMDGMRHFANQGDEQAHQCLQVLQVIADKADPSQAFLSIALSEK